MQKSYLSLLDVQAIESRKSTNDIPSTSLVQSSPSIKTTYLQGVDFRSKIPKLYYQTNKNSKIHTLQQNRNTLPTLSPTHSDMKYSS